jgi:2,3-bisphosphoglycerate-dependent phosphoglycerate mutase
VTGPTGTAPPTAEIYLVRHGESMWNAAGLLQGRAAEVALTRLGIRQSARAAALVADRGITEIWSSPQRRARQTAEALARTLRLPVRTCRDLSEQGHGVWEGRPAASYGALLAAAGPDWAPPGGESKRQVLARARRFLGHRSWTGPAAVVTHGETIRALVAAAWGLGPAALASWTPPNGAVIDLAGGPGAALGDRPVAS